MNQDSTNHTLTSYQPGVALDDLQLIVTQTPTEVWAALRNQRIFITGGTGFVGCWLLEALLWANAQLDLNLHLSVLSRDPAAFTIKAPHLATHKIVTLIQGDVTALDKIHEPFDSVIHAATDVVKTGDNPIATFDNIVQGTRATLALAQRAGARRYLLTSSGAVYGRQPTAISHIAENYSGAPDSLDINNAYGQGKRVSEWLAHNFAQQYNIQVKVARCFALLGPYLPLDAHFAAGNFIRDGLDNRTIAINGDGTSSRSYLYAADMTVWLLTMLINGRSQQNYNLGSAQAISIKTLAETISDIIYGENRVTIAQQPVTNGPIQQYVPDVSKAHQELELAQYTDLLSAIHKTIAWEKRRRLSAAHNH
ncbi:NAD-dependent epimerase/dehydratase family protein [Cellvibrio fibrivorans]|uniref:dTDP-glucose 4,6-dehydratase n=1 Tax=Cellvibrio fibrivorans TaxID=126350 RepID=A0ABU1V0U7_9GAMM|nr:NAD-dependent epimerase/dehydratase family protein [Cellvibrio fibrivorans]MDR7091067.1 dTDP-glucose 4,6-dehydratase [Cellvibrio fibrivorans]